MIKLIFLAVICTNIIVAQKKTISTNLETITLGGGCYWCVEAVYENLNGVTNVVSGFSG
ncbi:peptide-methionine (S)-S-oxide reductase, partial [Flavobacterium sp.]|uniref:peptide-methionine (S)-S-oxide reductase n=1 Tax=Flavobacterium sp. TaxID=239 RepID=UPI0037532514